MFQMTKPNGQDVFEKLRQEVNQAFGRMLPSFWHNGDEFWATHQPFSGTLPVELEDQDQEICVRAELPGLSKNDIHVELLNDRLTLTGEKKSKCKEKKNGSVYSEISYGTFSRTIDLPCEVDPARCEAVFKDGVLQLKLSKVAAAKRKRIELKVK